MDLELTVIGISHRTAPLAVRERYVVSQGDLPACLAAIASVPGVSEAFLLSTCNRSEVLVVGKPEQEIAAGVRAHLFRNLGDEEVYVWSGLQALIHVFRVASGLDSVVVGESEVLAQMKRGMEAARVARTLGPTLQALLQQALHVGKRVRSETEVGQGTLSVARVAVDVAAHAFGNLDRCRAWIVGAGETGLLVARHLVDRGLRQPTFANRTLERAREAASEFGGRAVALDAIEALSGEADLVVTCVEGLSVSIDAQLLDVRVLRKRDRPLLAIDLSVPRAIDPGLAKLPNVLLYDLDDLQRVVHANRKGRDVAIEGTAEILVSELHKFLSLRAYASFTPAIAAMRERFERVREDVLDSVAGSRTDKKDIEIAHELTRRLLDVALVQMKEGARATSSEETLDREYQRFLQGLESEPRS
jgi:glutamyl-tRNA reductase